MWRCVVILLLAPLAGCAEADESADPDEVPPGFLRGVVVDPSIQPVPGASVVMAPGGHNVTTDDEGAFEFRDLEPGTYTLTAWKEGYLEEVVVAAVLARSTDEVVKIVLLVDTEIRQYATAYYSQGFFECGVWPTNGCANINIITWIMMCQIGLCLGNVTGDRSVALQWLDSPPSFLQTELVWTSTQPAGDSLSFALGGATKEELSQGMAPGYNWTQGESPLMLRVDEETLKESKIGAERAMFTQISSSPGISIPGGCVVANPCGPGVQLLQDFEVFTHTFHGYEPPSDWLFTEHGAPPGP